MSQFSERAVKLQKAISIYERKRNEIRFEWDTEVTNENFWGASYLYAALLLKCHLKPYFSISRKELNVLYEKFNNDTGRVCDLDDLFSRSWLRMVNGKVHIAGTIRHSVLNIEKVAGLDNEFSFLSGVHRQYNNKKIPEEEFSKLADDYQAQHSCKLDLDKAAKAYWLEIKDNHVAIPSLVYYEPLLQHADDFLFIKELSDILNNRMERGLYISKKDASEILLNHRTVFPQTPTEEAFLEKKVLIEDHDNYVLNFRNTEITFGGIIHDKAGALLWEMLIKDSAFPNDRERILFWCDRLVYSNTWCHIHHSFTSGLKLRFIDAATEILLNENDLSVGEDEFQKIILDTGHHLSNFAYVLSLKKRETKFPIGDDIFDLYNGLEELDDEWQGQLLHHQESRSILTYLIHQVVRNDFNPKYERIFKLITSGSKKIFLLWEAAFVIYHWEPGIIPFLFINRMTASLGSTLLLKAKSPEGVFNERHAIFKKIAEENFQLFCDFLAISPEIMNKEKAGIIFQNLLPLVNEKFVIKGPGLDRQKLHKKESNEIVLLLQSTIENTKLPGNYYTGGASFKKLMYPSLLNELYDQINSYSPRDSFRYSSIALPFTRIDMLIWLSQLVNKSGVDGSEKSSLNYKICNTFLKHYLEIFNTVHIKRWDIDTGELNDSLPIWSNQQPNVELIDWMYIFLELEKEKLLDDLLSPTQLKFKETNDQYDHYNGFVANKLRTHLSILITGYNNLYNRKAVLAAKNSPIDTVLDKLEFKITSIITLYCKNEPEKARLDIFSLLLERTFWSTEREELLPVISSTINRFKKTNKESIIKELVKTDQLVRSFKLLDYLASEKDKEYLIALITENDIEKFFLESYPNDAEYVLQKLVEEKKFEEKANQALGIWEKRKVAGMQNEKDQHAVMCFRMRLLLAYHELNEEKVKSTPEPALSGSIESNKFHAQAEKDFYRALIYLQTNEPNKSYNIFNNQLASSSGERPTLGLNRFASKLKWADQTEDLDKRKKLFQEAIEEWELFEKNLSKDLDINYIKDKIWYNKLHAYSGLNNNDAFDLQFGSIDKSFQLRPDFLGLRLKNLMERGMQHQAESLLAEAEEYHRLSNGQVPDSVLSLRNITDSEETNKYLQNMYSRIFSKPPEQLIKILPDVVNKFSSLEEFLLSEIVGAATDMLTYINSISDIKLEDKYSDLMILSLANRFRNYGWHVSPNRGGAPASGNSNPGLIDFAIVSSRNDRMAICEALRLTGINRTEVQNHNFKIFNYDPSKNLFFIITYFKGDMHKFAETWDTYKTDVSTSVVFPTGFELASGNLEDISNKLGTDAVKAAKSIHGSNTPIYHVFININYLREPNQ